MTITRKACILIVLLALSLSPLFAWSQVPMPPPETVNPPLTFATDTPRQTRSRDTLPDVVAARVPQRGIYAAGGGLTSSAWRIVINIDVLSADYGTTEAPGSPSFGDMEQNWQWLLAYPEIQPLIPLADAAWREERRLAADPTVDYGEIIVLADGDEVHLIEGFGPIEAPAAKALLDALHALHETR